MADLAVRRLDGPPRILHVHGSFSLGGKEARAVRLMNLWGERFHHSIVSAAPHLMNAREAIAPGTPVDFPEPPPLAGRPGLKRYREIARFLAGYDLILSYNWGAMDAVMAHRIYAHSLKLPPLIHHEDGFNADEADRLKPQRNFFRRIALRHAHALVVPSIRLDAVARHVWRQPSDRVHLIRNGIDTALYAQPPVADALPGARRDDGKLVVGTLAGLRPVKNIPRLVRAVAPHRDRIRLVVVGEGPERDAIVAEAQAQGVELHLAGFLAEPWRFIGLFDIFALSSDSEQFPISLIEAMAASLPVAATDVGDVAHMVAAENRPFIAPDERGLADAIGALVADASLRQRLGAANRQRAERDFTEQAMVDAYESLYGEALSSPRILG